MKKLFWAETVTNIDSWIKTQSMKSFSLSYLMGIAYSFISLKFLSVASYILR